MAKQAAVFTVELTCAFVSNLKGDGRRVHIIGEHQKIYEADSPITYIRSEKAPLLVLQGDNDIRVPKEEAEQVVSILKQEGRTIEAHYYPNEGHGFSKRENQIDAMRRTIEWFDRYLKGNARSQ